jgi:predicted nucleic acid-binding protein
LRFWDSSALVPLLTLEPTSAQMLELYQIDPALLVWWGTETELASVLARLEREGTLQPEEADQAFARLMRLKSAWHEVLPSEEVRETARRFLRVHPLRAMDALQLAAAFAASRGRPSQLSGASSLVVSSW